MFYELFTHNIFEYSFVLFISNRSLVLDNFHKLETNFQHWLTTNKTLRNGFCGNDFCGNSVSGKSISGKGIGGNGFSDNSIGGNRTVIVGTALFGTALVEIPLLKKKGPHSFWPPESFFKTTVIVLRKKLMIGYCYTKLK